MPGGSHDPEHDPESEGGTVVAEVVLKDVDKIYEGDVHAVQSLSLDIADGEFLVLVGPSGCGKTTALRMVAGLETISAGVVSIGGRVVNDLSPKDRDIAMVFQSYALYPHLSVADNIAFGLRLRKVPRAVIDERIAWAAKLLDLTPYLARKPKELSGGQRQRVAMGRAIVREPQVFLMDEPLSNLDAKLRVQMRAEVAKLQHDLGVTTVYVTHDQVEAMTMGDRVAVMSMGKLQQVDTPQHLYDEPFNMFVASFIGTPPMNLVEAVVRTEGETVMVVVGPTSIPVGAAALARYPRVRERDGQMIVLGMRAEDLYPGASRPDDPFFNARIDLVEALGSGVMAYFTIDAVAVRTEAHALQEDAPAEGEESIASARPNLVAAFPPRVQLKIGDSIPVAIDPENLHFFDRETGAALR
jgi:multiple sugar transport system ATP-binding protein